MSFRRLSDASRASAGEHQQRHCVGEAHHDDVEEANTQPVRRQSLRRWTQSQDSVGDSGE